MKTRDRRFTRGTAALLLLLLGGVGVAQATPMVILSGSPSAGVSEWNNWGADLVITNPHDGSVWATSALGAQWISYTDSGAGTALVPSMWPPTEAGATFYVRFTVPQPILAGQLRIWADDVAQVWLDSEPTPRIPLPAELYPDSYCIHGNIHAIGCEQLEFGTLNLAGLSAGEHTVGIQVWQLWGDSYGVMYEGQIELVPEPSTFALMLSPLAIIALRILRKRT